MNTRPDNAARLRRALANVHRLCDALGLLKGSKRQPRGGLHVLCPWHEERTPSCSVTLGEDGTIRAHCFGCGQSGDALSLIAAARGLDIKTQFGAVIEQAAEIAGTESPRCGTRKPEQPALNASSYTALATRLVELCPLTEAPDVLAYVERRGLLVEGAHAQLAALPAREKQAPLIAALLRGFELETLAGACLINRDRRPRELFAFPDHRLIIPWRSLDGSIAVLQRRRVVEHHEPKYVFPSGMRPLYPFGTERLRAHGAGRMVVFVEGAVDVLALRLLGNRHGLDLLPLGLPGLQGWRAEWARLAKGCTVRIGFDADAAGARMVESVARDLYAAGAAKVERWTPAAKDWAELVERVRARQAAL